MFRQDRQVIISPLGILWVIAVCIRKTGQMTHAPADEIAVALKVAVFAAGGAKDFCIGHSDGWLFRHD